LWGIILDYFVYDYPDKKPDDMAFYKTGFDKFCCTIDIANISY